MDSEKKINIQRTSNSRLSSTDFNNLSFGKTLSDHMVMVDYKDGNWLVPEIIPTRKLEFNPSLTALHYGQTIFEGLKAFKNIEGEILMFRPDQHAERMNSSASRLCMPAVPKELFLDTLYELIKLDKDWVPDHEGSSLYIRPFMFSTDEELRVRPSESHVFIIVTSPVSSYYTGTVKVLVEETYVRAAEGGTGYVKTGGNYAASLLPATKALEKGYDQVLWTDAKEHNYIEEIGTMNVLFEIDNKIITSELSTSTLSGITRKSVLELARHWGYEVEERKISIDEVVTAYQEGRLNDAFGTGTAATITPISTIGYKGTDYVFPENLPREFSTKASNYLSALKVGKAEDYMNWMVKL